MIKDNKSEKLRIKLQKTLLEFRKYRISKGKITKKPGLFSKMFG
jgi:hypothetical protein